MEQDVAQAKLTRLQGMCRQWGLDLTVGCEHECAYCPFHEYQALTLRRAHEGRGLARRLDVEAFLRQEQYPSGIYFSPFTDPLAPAAQENLTRILQRVLPLGVRVGISTKGIVPRTVWEVLAEAPEQVILFIGVASLNADRNRAVERGCPPALARLDNVRLARDYGLNCVCVRMDPLLPGIDDSPHRLHTLLDEVAECGARHVIAAYLGLSLLSNRVRLRQMPYLGRAAAACVELCPVWEGTVWSVPLARKRETYDWLHTECSARGLGFATCGCKDLRLTVSAYGTCCSQLFPATSAAAHFQVCR